MKVGDRIDSGPSSAGDVDERYGGKIKRREEKRCERGIWDKRGRNVFIEAE